MDEILAYNREDLEATWAVMELAAGARRGAILMPATDGRLEAVFAHSPRLASGATGNH